MAKSKKSAKKITPQDEFTVKYVIPEDQHDRFINGIWGGFTQEGMMNMHFYHERLPLPKKTYHEITEEGVRGQGRAEFGGNVVRIVQSSLIMNVGMAVQLRDWLNDNLANIEAKVENDE